MIIEQKVGGLKNEKVKFDLKDTRLIVTYATKFFYQKEYKEDTSVEFLYTSITPGFNKDKVHSYLFPILQTNMRLTLTAVLLVFIFLGSTNQKLFFSTTALIFIPLYVLVLLFSMLSDTRKRIIVSTHEGGKFTIYDNKEGESIYEKIMKNRTDYLTERYNELKDMNYGMTVDTLEYFLINKIIDQAEYDVQKTKIREQKNNKVKVGLNIDLDDEGENEDNE